MTELAYPGVYEQPELWALRLAEAFRDGSAHVTGLAPQALPYSFVFNQLLRHATYNTGHYAYAAAFVGADLDAVNQLDYSAELDDVSPAAAATSIDSLPPVDRLELAAGVDARLGPVIVLAEMYAALVKTAPDGRKGWTTEKCLRQPRPHVRGAHALWLLLEHAIAYARDDLPPELTSSAGAVDLPDFTTARRRTHIDPDRSLELASMHVESRYDLVPAQDQGAELSLPEAADPGAAKSGSVGGLGMFDYELVEALAWRDELGNASDAADLMPADGEVPESSAPKPAAPPPAEAPEELGTRRIADMHDVWLGNEVGRMSNLAEQLPPLVGSQTSERHSLEALQRWVETRMSSLGRAQTAGGVAAAALLAETPEFGVVLRAAKTMRDSSRLKAASHWRSYTDAAAAFAVVAQATSDIAEQPAASRARQQAALWWERFQQECNVPNELRGTLVDPVQSILWREFTGGFVERCGLLAAAVQPPENLASSALIGKAHRKAADNAARSVLANTGPERIHLSALRDPVFELMKSIPRCAEAHLKFNTSGGPDYLQALLTEQSARREAAQQRHWASDREALKAASDAADAARAACVSARETRVSFDDVIRLNNAVTEADAKLRSLLSTWGEKPRTSEAELRARVQRAESPPVPARRPHSERAPSRL